LSRVVVARNLGSTAIDSGPAIETGVSWDDIGGLSEAKRQLIEAIEAPFLNKELYARYGRKQPRGVLLCGPSGTGKTMLAKAAATAIAKLHGKHTAGTGFVYVKGPEILHGLVGSSEANVRALFE